ncbi:MAG: B12-binding domain-containing protein, partial [Deltaproteobacteria bacterium]
MTHRERMLAVAKGEMPDVIPYAPRIDLWYHANKQRGTLPELYREATCDGIARAEGWALHKVILEYIEHGEDAILDRLLGVYRIPSQGFLSHLPEEVERCVMKKGDRMEVEYHTPKGKVRGAFVYSSEMRRSGVSIPWISEHVLKAPDDYEPVGYIFEHMRIESNPEGYLRWAEPIGEDGLPVAYALTAGSPMHHVMKILMDINQFYYQHRDHEKRMLQLAERIGVYFRKVLDVVAEGPAEIVLIGANFDDTITYPPFFRDHILPWLQEASEKLHRHGKLMLCHCDGENQGLMDYLSESGMDIAEAICPYPMTHVTLAEYYSRWSENITIFGGIPSNMLLAESATYDEFEAYLDSLFKVVVPGKRLILGIADTAPPDAVFERLIRIGQRVEKEGRLPIGGGAPGPISERQLVVATARVPLEVIEDDIFRFVKEDVFNGSHLEIKRHVQELLTKGVNARDILKLGMLSVMEVIGERFRTGEVFIPEVLLSARVMHEGLLVLEPHFAGGQKEASGKVFIGTVRGDLHDIGKNMV